MKKIIICLLSVLFILTPVLVNADMGAPEFIEFEAFVSNPDGAKYYDDDEDTNSVKGSLDYETKIIVEYKYNGWARFRIKKDGPYTNEESYYIKEKNISVKAEGTPLTDKRVKDVSKKNRYLYVIANKGIKAYTGVSNLFNLVMTIPYNGKAKIEAYYDSDEGVSWYYVTYNNKSGWIHIVDDELNDGVTVGFVATFKGEVYTIEDEKIEISKGKSIVVPKETKFTADDFYTLDDWHNRWNIYLKDYKGYSGMLNIDNLYIKGNKDIKIKKKTSLVKYDLNVVDFDHTIVEKKDIVATIPAGTTVKAFGSLFNYDNVYLVEYNGGKGFIIKDYQWETLEEEEEEPTTKKPTTTTTTILEDETDPTSTTTTTEAVEEEKEESKKSPEAFIIMCVAGCIALAITNIITLILLHKKKINKKEEKEEKLEEKQE